MGVYQIDRVRSCEGGFVAMLQRSAERRKSERRIPKDQSYTPNESTAPLHELTDCDPDDGRDDSLTDIQPFFDEQGEESELLWCSPTARRQRPSRAG